MLPPEPPAPNGPLCSPDGGPFACLRDTSPRQRYRDQRRPTPPRAGRRQQSP